MLSGAAGAQRRGVAPTIRAAPRWLLAALREGALGSAQPRALTTSAETPASLPVIPRSPKIFGIGLNKTGTTTLGQCGRLLGLRCTSFDRDLLDDWIERRDLARITARVEQFDLFEDWPWPLVYPQLDALFPGSKFVLTVRRSPEAWLDSLKRHSLRTHPSKHCRKLAYGYDYPHGREQEHLDFYSAHNAAAREYFADRPGDFAELCWERGDGFAELCALLGTPVPRQPFPHANKGTEAKVNEEWVALNRAQSERQAAEVRGE